MANTQGCLATEEGDTDLKGVGAHGTQLMNNMPDTFTLADERLFFGRLVKQRYSRLTPIDDDKVVEDAYGVINAQRQSVVQSEESNEGFTGCSAAKLLQILCLP